MPNMQLTPDQLTKLSEISNPLVRQRFTVFYQLPQDMQDTFVSENTTNSVWNIAKEKYQLSDKNVSAVARIIGLIFLGELPIKNFIMALQRDLNVDVKTAQAIAQDINMAIFQPVRESLMQVHGLASDTNTRMHTDDANQEIHPLRPDSNRDFAGQARNDTNQEITNYKTQNPNKYQTPNSQISKTEPRQIPYAPVRPNVSGDAQRRREEILNKIRNQPTNQARPAVLRLIPPKKNIVDLRVLAKKKHYNKRREYDGFFSA
jgi:hypothetical protein